MQAHLLVGPIPVKASHSFSSAVSCDFAPPLSDLLNHQHFHRRRHCDGRSRCQGHRWKTTVTVAAAASSSSSSWSSPSPASIGGGLNHYAVLGIARDATPADVKRAYRLLARKFHPDVSKDARAGELFKRIRNAYEVLSNEASRIQYDRALKFQENSRTYRVHYSPDIEDNMKYYYSRAETRRRSRYERFYRYYNKYPNSNPHFYNETTNKGETALDPASFLGVLKSAFLSIFLLKTFGTHISLAFSTITALFDGELDLGYKLGHVIAWILGGRAGILLTLCLTFASWLCGKASSSVVVLVLVAMWVGSNLARHAPLPQGALLTLLYMSIKLQANSS